MDKLEESIMRSDDVIGMLTYCVNISQTFVNRREYRHEVVLCMPILKLKSINAYLFSYFYLQVLKLLVKIYQSLETPDYLSISQCLMFLDDPGTVASILEILLKGDKVVFKMCIHYLFSYYCESLY